MTSRPSTRSSAAGEPPAGLTYREDFLSAAEEEQLIAELERLELREVVMHGTPARRRVLHFGWDYDYDGWKIHPADPPPPWLAELRDRCAGFAGVEPEVLEQFLIARYPAGATIGWHRDAPMFGAPVVGVSLVSPCTMKFRRRAGERFEVWPQQVNPRSIYLLDGDARTKWQHSIPPTKALRYSITMRTLKKRA